MPEQRQGAVSSVWRTDLNLLIRKGPASAIKNYSIFSGRLVPGRASSQAWILAVATIGLLILYPLFAAQLFFTYWNAGPSDIDAMWENARPKPVLGGMLTIPAHLSEYEIRGEEDRRIVFGLTLAEILTNAGRDNDADFSRNALGQQITLTYFRPDRSTLGLSGFYKLYGRYLDPDKRVGSDGLTTQNFVRDGPFDNEILRYETGYNRDRYFVRCFEGASSDRLNTCYRTLKVSDDLALRYTFNEGLLDNWVGLEAVIVTLANRMMDSPEVPTQP